MLVKNQIDNQYPIKLSAPQHAVRLLAIVLVFICLAAITIKILFF
jgi:hypothetical protein